MDVYRDGLYVKSYPKLVFLFTGPVYLENCGRPMAGKPQWERTVFMRTQNEHAETLTWQKGMRGKMSRYVPFTEGTPSLMLWGRSGFRPEHSAGKLSVKVIIDTGIGMTRRVPAGIRVLLSARKNMGKSVRGSGLLFKTTNGLMLFEGQGYSWRKMRNYLPLTFTFRKRDEKPKGKKQYRSTSLLQCVPLGCIYHPTPCWCLPSMMLPRKWALPRTGLFQCGKEA